MGERCSRRAKGRAFLERWCRPVEVQGLDLHNVVLLNHSATSARSRVVKRAAHSSSPLLYAQSCAPTRCDEAGPQCDESEHTGPDGILVGASYARPFCCKSIVCGGRDKDDGWLYDSRAWWRWFSMIREFGGGGRDKVREGVAAGGRWLMWQGECITVTGAGRDQ